MINIIPFLMELGLVEQDEQFTQWYNKYYESLYRYNLRRNTDPDTALDITQESFAILFSLGSKINNESYFRRCMYTVAKNLSSNSRRLLKNKRHLSLNALEQDIGFLPVDNTQTDTRFVYKEIEEILDRLIRQLPEKEKDVLILKNQEGMTYRDIAKITGQSERHLKRLAKSGLQKVLNELEKLGIAKEGKLL